MNKAPKLLLIPAVSLTEKHKQQKCSTVLGPDCTLYIISPNIVWFGWIVHYLASVLVIAQYIVYLLSALAFILNGVYVLGLVINSLGQKPSCHCH